MRNAVTLSGGNASLKLTFNTKHKSENKVCGYGRSCWSYAERNRFAHSFIFLQKSRHVHLREERTKIITGTSVLKNVRSGLYSKTTD